MRSITRRGFVIAAGVVMLPTVVVGREKGSLIFGVSAKRERDLLARFFLPLGAEYDQYFESWPARVGSTIRNLVEHPFPERQSSDQTAHLIHRGGRRWTIRVWDGAFPVSDRVLTHGVTLTL